MIAVHGHRGARALFPENTLPAFRHAIECGADFLELDVLATSDDVLVACHDPVLNPRRCTAPRGTCVRRETLAALREWDFGAYTNRRFRRQTAVPGTTVPTLDDVLRLAASAGVRVNIEAKSFPKRPELAPPPEQYARLLAGALRARRMEKRVIVQSFDYRVLGALRRLAPQVPLAALYGPGLRPLTSIAREAEVRIVAPHHRLATRRRVRAAHRAGLKVIVWTANTRLEWARLVRAEVDGIITDDPAGLIAFLKQKGLR